MVAPEIWQDIATGNSYFIAVNARGKEVVLDQYVVLRDFGDGRLAYVERETKQFWKNLNSVLEAAGAVALFAGDIRLRALLRTFGVKEAVLDGIMEKIKGVATHRSLDFVTEALNDEELTRIHALITEAVSDGVFTLEEYKQIQDLVNRYRTATKV